jgi:hypothetical protein
MFGNCGGKTVRKNGIAEPVIGRPPKLVRRADLTFAAVHNHHCRKHTGMPVQQPRRTPARDGAAATTAPSWRRDQQPANPREHFAHGAVVFGD